MTTDSRSPGTRPRSHSRGHPVNAHDVKIRRVEAGLTQVELADRIGVTQAYISDIERGLGNPGVKVLHGLATVFQCTVHDLMAKADE